MPSVDRNAVVFDYQQTTVIDSGKVQVHQVDLITVLCQKLVTAKCPFNFSLTV
jgi:hypothetical protein